MYVIHGKSSIGIEYKEIVSPQEKKVDMDVLCLWIGTPDLLTHMVWGGDHSTICMWYK